MVLFYINNFQNRKKPESSFSYIIEKQLHLILLFFLNYTINLTFDNPKVRFKLSSIEKEKYFLVFYLVIIKFKLFIFSTFFTFVVSYFPFLNCSLTKIFFWK